MGDVLKKFSRYFLLDHVAQGGMAEIFRARLAAHDGAGRILVIKRIQAGFGANEEFLQMFKSEIKVMMGFNHPNIVQLYDFGEENEQPYIAMEFVDGKNLRQVLTKFAERKDTLPVELAAHIIEQSALGLNYAHAFKDKLTGQPLNVVHRDISPQNVLISYDGAVKVIDFGIAKASTNSESTRAGVIKGKPSYLSPEQISGESLDGRCDIFALGIVFWELLVGKKLFAGESDLAVLKLIESSSSHVKAPSSLNPKVPKELDYIVLRALAKQREKRYQTADELARAIRKFLTITAPELSGSDLSYAVRELFKEEIVEDRKKMQRLNDKAEQLLADPHTMRTEAMDAGPGRGPSRDFDSTKLASSGVRDLAPETEKAVIELVGLNGNTLPNKRRSVPTMAPAQPALRMATPSVPAQKISPRKPAPSRPSRAKSSSGSAFGPGMRKAALAVAAAVVGIVIFGPDMGINIPGLSSSGNRAPSSVKPTPADPSKPQRAVATSPGTAPGSPFPATAPAAPAAPIPPPARGSIILRLNLTPGGGSPRILLNGKELDAANPYATVKIDEPMELSVERADFLRFRRDFVLDASTYGGLKEWLMDVPLEPLKFGLLTLRTNPVADATIVIGEGKPWTRRTPIENEKFPAGTYNIRLSNDLLGMEKTITVRIRDGGSVDLGEVKLDIKN